MILKLLVLLTVLLTLLTAAPARAAFTLIAHTGYGSTDGNTFSTSSINTTSVDLIVVLVSALDGATCTLSDSKSNTWTAGTLRAVSSSNTVQLYHTVPSSVGSGHTFTLTGSGCYGSLQVLAFSGAHATPVDTETGTTVAYGESNFSAQPGSITPAQNSELLVTGISLSNSLGGSNIFSIDSSFTILDQHDLAANQHYATALGYKILSGAGAENPTWSWSNGFQSVAVAMKAFKAATVGNGARPRPVVMIQ